MSGRCWLGGLFQDRDFNNVLLIAPPLKDNKVEFTVCDQETCLFYYFVPPYCTNMSSRMEDLFYIRLQ